MDIIFWGYEWFWDYMYLLHRPEFVSPVDTKKMIFTVSLLGANQHKGSVGNKPETSIGIVWQRYLTLYLTPPYLE